MKQDKLEKIGNVTLDYSYYSGEDVYSEGEAEDALLEMVKNHVESDYAKLIQETCSWSVMYHLSNIRENIVSWIPIKSTDRVLEIGAGCGAVTGELANHAESVTCIDLSKKRSLINAYRHKTYDNINILVGNFKIIEPNLRHKYDIITLIGVYEYAQSYMGGKTPYEDFLRVVSKHLKPDGKLVIAIENRLGLKYFAGCKEDHLGNYFSGVEGYTERDGVRTFSRGKLERLITGAGLFPKFYYPYPDYKLPHTIYSDDKLPSMGELTTNMRNFDNDRMIMFDEAKAFDAIIEDGMFPQYANSFLVIAGKEKDWAEREGHVLYAKYANERLDKYMVATIIEKDGDGDLHVIKRALSPRANAHIQTISDNYTTLTDMYEGIGFRPVDSEFTEGVERRQLVAGVPSRATSSLEMEYVDGITLEAYLDELEARAEYRTMELIIREFVARMNKIPRQVPFKSCAKFEEIFGKRNFAKEYMAVSPTNYDMIFSNIVLDKETLEKSVWRVLDYEWIFDFPIPIQFLIYRSLFYQFHEKEDGGFAQYLERRGTDVYTLCGMDIGERMLFDDMEHSFQLHVIGGYASLEVMQVMMPSTAVDVTGLVESASYFRNLDTPKVYYSHTKAFTPDAQMKLIAKEDQHTITLRVPVEQYTTSVRIDPTEFPCLLFINYIRTVNSNGEWNNVESVVVNAYAITEKALVFDTDDAQIIVYDLPTEVQTLEISYKVAMLDDIFYKEIVESVKKKEELDKEVEKAFSYRVKRKIGAIKPEILPEGYKRVSLIKREESKPKSDNKKG